MQQIYKIVVSATWRRFRIVHTADFNKVSGVVPPPSVIPWEIYAGRKVFDLAKDEFRTGRAMMLYPEGIGIMQNNETDFLDEGKRELQQCVDDAFGNSNAFSASDFAATLEKAFTLRKEFRDVAKSTLNGILSKHAEKRAKKKSKKAKQGDLVLVGIHSRMTDHQSLERESGNVPVKASYFVQAMDMYRNYYKNVVFIYVSDDMDWGRRHLAPRNKFGDLYFASEGRPMDKDRYLGNIPNLELYG
jgi:hypothetical protein